LTLHSSACSFSTSPWYGESAYNKLHRPSPSSRSGAGAVLSFNSETITSQPCVGSLVTHRRCEAAAAVHSSSRRLLLVRCSPPAPAVSSPCQRPVWRSHRRLIRCSHRHPSLTVSGLQHAAQGQGAGEEGEEDRGGQDVRSAAQARRAGVTLQSPSAQPDRLRCCYRALRAVCRAEEQEQEQEGAAVHQRCGRYGQPDGQEPQAGEARRRTRKG
jgi:hypothetical protein